MNDAVQFEETIVTESQAEHPFASVTQHPYVPGRSPYTLMPVAPFDHR
jgi:hypothetical protein